MKNITLKAVLSVAIVGALAGCEMDKDHKEHQAVMEQKISQVETKVDALGADLNKVVDLMNTTQAALVASMSMPQDVKAPEQTVAKDEKTPEQIVESLSEIGIAKIDTVRKISENLYEVSSGTQIAYTSTDGKYLLAGPLVDIVNKRNLTQERISELSKIDVSKVDIKNAITIVRGEGKDKFYMFSDPECPYCRTLEKDIQAGKIEALNNATIYLLPVVVAGHQDSSRMIDNILCEADPAKAWTEYLTSDEILKTYMDKKDTPKACGVKAPTKENEELMMQLRVMGTPAIYNSEGKSIR
jgi:thiol:disulfide interchange protein DsbC